MKFDLLLFILILTINIGKSFGQDQDTLLKYKDYISAIDRNEVEKIILCDSGYLIGWTFRAIDDTICVTYNLEVETNEIVKIEIIGHGTAESRSTYYFNNKKLIMIRAIMFSGGFKNWDSYIYYYNDEEFHQDYIGSELYGKAFVRGAYELLNYYK